MLGIDAAWTGTQPSGVALAAEIDDCWTLLAAAPSFRDFVITLDRTTIPTIQSNGSKIDAKALLDVVEALAGRRPDLVAVDMPLAHTPIIARRSSDDAVSRLYGAKWCGTHTPSAARPGPIGAALADAFAAEGFRLATEMVTGPSLVEVYPHPALVELAGANRRLPYKAQKIRSYWPDLTPGERKHALFAIWAQIVKLLDGKIAGTRALLPKNDQSDRGATLKAFEDMLDAVVCVWIGITILEGRAAPHGDADSAIWIPTSAD